MGYTLLHSTNDEKSNIYRILDEIKACISSIKTELQKLKFSGDFGIALGGASAGAHLSLLYSYLIDDSEIPIKYVINIVGPLGLNPDYYYALKNINYPLDIETFENLTKIKEEINTNKLVLMRQKQVEFVYLLNYFIGNKYSNEFINSMFKGKDVDFENANFTELVNEVKYSDIRKIRDKNKCPTLCIYGGRDITIGSVQFAYLKEKADNDGRLLTLIYSKYVGHSITDIDKTSDETKKDGYLQIQFMNSQILNFSQMYFKENE